MIQMEKDELKKNTGLVRDPGVYKLIEVLPKKPFSRKTRKGRS
jgi:hypothetical protein